MMLALAPTLVRERNLNLKRIFFKKEIGFFLGVYFEGEWVLYLFYFMLLIMSMVWGMSEVGKKKNRTCKGDYYNNHHLILTYYLFFKLILVHVFMLRILLVRR